LGYSRLKTKHVAAVSVQNFLWRHPTTYYWTFTVHEVLEDKAEAMSRAKPLFDLIGRKTGLSRAGDGPAKKTQGEYLAFWELQKRGSWHLHLLTSVYLDVNWLRPWMMARGWGQQMRVELVRVPFRDGLDTEGNRWYAGVANTRGNGGLRLARYLTKYLSKSFCDVPGKKPFSGSAAAKSGTIGFAWCPEVNPMAYLYYWGRKLWFELYGTAPRFDQIGAVCRLGFEDCDWASVDPWMDPPG
jgi:hypothetical protein